MGSMYTSTGKDTQHTGQECSRPSKLQTRRLETHFITLQDRGPVTKADTTD